MKRFYINTVVAILIVAGVVKLFAFAQKSVFLSEANPLLQLLTNRHMSILVALVELGVATFLIRSHSLTLQLCLILWIGAAFLVYRLGLWAVDYRGPCSCIGGAITWFAQSRQARSVANLVLEGIVAYLVFPSTCFLIGARMRAGFDPKRVSAKVCVFSKE